MKSVMVQAAISLLVSVFTLFGSYLLYGPKLRIEQKTDFQKRIGERKASALIKLKELIKDCDAYDLLVDEDELSNSMLFGVKENQEVMYASIMADEESLSSFMDKVRELREEEMYLGREAAAYVVYLYRYLYEMTNLIMVKYSHVYLPLLGSFFIIDFKKWAEEADKIAIRDINDAKTTMESQKDDEWIRIRDRVYDKLYEQSILYKIQNPTLDGSIGDIEFNSAIEELNKWENMGN